MKKRTLSILLCMVMAFTAMPYATVSVWADASEPADVQAVDGQALIEQALNAQAASEGEASEPAASAPEPILAYLPLDNRPVNVDRVIYEAESAGFRVLMPDADLYTTRLDGQPRNSNGTSYGDGKKLMEWIEKMDAQTDYFVISLDQLLSGGLVNSRTITSKSYAAEHELIDAIVTLSETNHVYVMDTVARLATCTVGYQGATLDTYNYLRQYSLMPRYEIKSGNLTVKGIVGNYNYDADGKMIRVDDTRRTAVNDMLKTRARKLDLIDYILTKDAAGNIKYFIGIDDSSSQSTIQSNEIHFIEKKLGERGLIYSGTDELGMMAVLSLMIDHYGYDVKAATVYFGETESSAAGSIYDMETVRVNLEQHLKSIGVQQVDRADADLEIVVLTTPAQNLLNVKYIDRTIDYLNDNIAKGIPTILINAAPSVYNGSLEYRMTRECEMSMLLSYSSWNTVGNSVGLALGNGISRYLYLHSRDNSSNTADIAFLKGLIFSYEKDISYQKGGGKDLFNKYLTEKGWSASNFYQSDSQVAQVNADLENLLKTSDYNVTVADIVDNMTGCRYFKSLEGQSGIIGKIKLSNYAAPFFRTFEIRFDIDVSLSSATMNGFHDTMTVSIPYQPQEGQLTYAVTLYYLDEDGKLHKIPCVYDRTTGMIRFSAGLSGFFTDTLSMDAATAYSLFSDVPASAWYFDYVMYVHERGLMQGTTKNTFAPNAYITRAMLAQILYNMAGSPSASTQPTEATEHADTVAALLPESETAWYGAAAAWALRNEIILDYYGQGTFGATERVTREQLADILWRYAKYKGMDTDGTEFPGVYNYADVFAVTPAFRDGFDWACRYGILQGKGSALLKPQDSTTRAEMAVVLRRFAE